MPAFAFCQLDSTQFKTGVGNVKLPNGDKFTITRPNGTPIYTLPNYLKKKQVDDIINYYNDTTNKFSIDCVDSLWKSGNIVYHRNWKCDIQTFDLGQTVDGCTGGRVYHKNTVADTSFLTPSPTCGDVLVVEGDTCKDYLYIKGNAPPKWNFIGAYLKNSNCFDPLPCKDSIWKIGLTYYYRNVDCFVFKLKDSIGTKNDTLYTLISDASQFRVSHKPDNSTYFTLKAGENINFSNSVTGANGETTINSKSSTSDTLYTTIANSSQLKFTHKPASSTDVAINAGNGIKFNNASVGANNVHGTIEIAVDTTNSAFKKNYYSVNNIGSGAKVYKNKTTSGDTTQFNLRSVLSNDGTVTVTENSNDINLSANVNNRDSISHNASIYQFERKDYAKGLYIGGSTFTAGNNIEFSSPVPGSSGSIVINAIDNGGCFNIATGFWGGYLAIVDPITNCIRKMSCPYDPCSQPPPLPPPSYQQFNVGSSSVDLSASSSTAQGYVNFSSGDIPSQKAKMNVFINGLKHNYTASPSAATFLSYTITGTTLTAYNGASPMTINQIEVNIYP